MAGAPIFDPAWYARLKAETPPPQGPFGGHPQGPEILAHLKTLPRAARAHWWRKNQHRVTNGEPVLDPREHPPDDVDLERPPPDDGLVAARRTWARDWAGELDLRRARLKVIEGGGEASAPAAPRLKVIEGGADPAPWADRRAARLAEEEAWIGRAAVGRARRLVEIEAAEKREAERPLHFKTVDALAKRLGQAVQDGTTGPLRGPPFG